MEHTATHPNWVHHLPVCLDSSSSPRHDAAMGATRAAGKLDRDLSAPTHMAAAIPPADRFSSIGVGQHTIAEVLQQGQARASCLLQLRSNQTRDLRIASTARFAQSNPISASLKTL